MKECEHLGRGSYCITCVEVMELQIQELEDKGKTWICPEVYQAAFLQLQEARKYAAPMNAKASVPRLKPCDHSEYWTTHYGYCMACRAVDAERQVQELRKLMGPYSTLPLALKAQEEMRRQNREMRDFILKNSPECPRDNPCSCTRCRFSIKQPGNNCLHQWSGEKMVCTKCWKVEDRYDSTANPVIDKLSENQEGKCPKCDLPLESEAHRDECAQKPTDAAGRTYGEVCEVCGNLVRISCTCLKRNAGCPKCGGDHLPHFSCQERIEHGKP